MSMKPRPKFRSIALLDTSAWANAISMKISCSGPFIELDVGYNFYMYNVLPTSWQIGDKVIYIKLHFFEKKTDI